VSDLVEGIYRLLQADFHEPVNLGNPDEVTILQFAEEIRKLAGGRNEIIFKPLPQDDPRVRKPDISRARKLLGWEPKIDRHEGLRRTMEYFRSRIGGK
jgi:dTDP-glucose 4,6-dehydratase